MQRETVIERKIKRQVLPELYLFSAIGWIAVEDLNSRLKLTFKSAFSFRTADAREVAFFHALGKLPEPQFNPQFLLDRRSKTVTFK
jgi:hypothetical protein